MSLDLDDLTLDWPGTSGEICARMVPGRDGASFVQLRVELGVLQMHLDGRPDGGRCHGLPTSQDYITHELRVGRALAPGDWKELDRELAQFNYRRLAFTSLAEDAMRANDRAAAATHLVRALTDIQSCLRAIEITEHHRPRPSPDHALRPILVFNRARLLSQWHVVEGLYDEGVEAAEGGARELRDLLLGAGFEPEQVEQDAGVAFLDQLAGRLRKQYGLAQTLRERFEQAIENEDFETAAQLREELRRREEKSRLQLPPPGDSA